MMKKLRNITYKRDRIYPFVGLGGLICFWHILCVSGIAPDFALPTPVAVLTALVKSFPLLMFHARVTLLTALAGLTAAVALAFAVAVAMDWFVALRKMLYPLLIVTQTVPVVAVAPLLVLWFGYGMTPKIILIVIVCFFPLSVGLLDAFQDVDKDVVNLLRAMGADRKRTFIHAKLPLALPAFFAGLKIAVSYAVVGAVIAEWLGGDSGLGVYMTRVRRSFAYDQLFAVILLISAVSIGLVWLVKQLEKVAMPWKNF